MSCNNSATTVAFSVAPLRIPSTCLRPSASTPTAPIIVCRRNATQQRIQHVLARLRLVLHSGVDGNLDFFAAALALGEQPGRFQLDIAVAEHQLPRLPAIEDHAFRGAFALLRQTFRHLRGAKLQHPLKNGSTSDINESITCHPALLDQLHHRQQTCPFLVRNVASSCSLTAPLRASPFFSCVLEGDSLKA